MGQGGREGGSEPIGALSLPAPPAPPAPRHGSEQRCRAGVSGRGPGSSVGWGSRRCRGLQGPPRPHPRAAPQMHFAQTCMAVTMATAARRRRHPNGDGGGGLSGDEGGGGRGRGCGAVTALLLQGGRPAGVHRWDGSRGRGAVAIVQRSVGSPRDRVQPIPAALLASSRCKPRVSVPRHGCAQCCRAGLCGIGAAPFPPLSARAVCSLAAVPSRLCPHVNL